MQGLSPLAVGIRTFVRLVAAAVIAAGAVDWARGGPDVKLAAVTLALAVIAAAVAGASAGILAWRDVRATTPLGKALAEFAQGVGGGLLTVGLADLTGAAAIVFGQSILRIIITAAVAAVVAFAQIGSEAAREPAA